MSEILTDIPQAESKVTVININPCLKNLSVTVNGKKLEVAGLKGTQERTIDISSAMVEGTAIP